METVKKNDFIEIEYTGKTKEENHVFDTTDEKVAKDSDIYNEKSEYAPSIVCIGENHILKGLDDQLIGKDIGKEYEISLSPENAFGRKDGKLIQLIPSKKFLQQRIQPMPGLQVNIDGTYGTIKTVSGGRCLVDFNHPLSGRELLYKVKINRIVEDNSEKLKALLKIHLYIKDAEVDASGDTANIKLKQELPKEVQEEFKKIVERSTSIKTLNFSSEPKAEKDMHKHDHKEHEHESHSHPGHDHAGHQH